jgi:phosphomethylpyrimidine synthase|tara:strand:+ start:915 stop:2177 length:1263 start_codon:yes stop_codon:yes gene_type:complete
MTILGKAKFNEMTAEIEAVAEDEQIKPKLLVKKVGDGHVVIPISKLHKDIKPMGIGSGLRTKINANIGSSPTKSDVQHELEKLKVAIGAGADTVMDLSTGGDIDNIRQEIVKNSSVPVGTVPIYQAVIEKDSVVELSADDMIKGIKKHIEDGVDFITIHSGVKKEFIPLVKKRMMGAVSRGGSFLMKWMEHNNKENPLYENFDKILYLAGKYDVTLSLGDGLRPGCIKDATDKAQLSELKVLGGLAKRAYDEGVQVMIEGPGHIPMDQIKMNIELQKRECNNAPFYVLGPIVTDIAPGYDHITSAIGGAIAAAYGADYLCYVTPTEHLGLPGIEDVKEGVIASKIAAHAADIAKGIKYIKEHDHKMALARANLDWEEMINLAIDPEKARAMREKCAPNDPKTCSMCDKFCSLKINQELKK